MQTKQQFKHYINAVIEQLQSVQLTENIKKSENLLTQISDAELIVPIVGGFSAGKSTLINSFLGKDLLPTAVTPETALAAELRFSTDEYIVAVQNGKEIRYSLDNLRAIKDNAQNFNYLKIYLNNPNLKTISPLVLVDMPGFGAANAAHNKAILEYLAKGNYFVFLTNAQDGTIGKDMVREIERLQDVGTDFSFCLSRTNERAPNAVNEVAEEISVQLQDKFGYNKELVRFDKNGGANLQKILTEIDPENLFKRVYLPKLDGFHQDVVKSVNTRLSTLKADHEEIVDASERLQKQKADLEKRKNSTLARVSDYTQNSTQGLINRIMSKLHEQQGVLVATAMRSQTAFAAELNDWVKDVSLRELKSQFEKIRDDVVSDIESEITANFSGLNGVNFSNFAGDLKIEPISVGQTQTVMSEMNNTGFLNTVKNLSDTLGNLIPVLKPATAMVSTIVSIVSAIFGSSSTRYEQPTISQADQEANARRQVETHYQTVILPKIKYELEGKLPDVLHQNIQQLIDGINEQFSRKVADKQREIDEEMQRKSAPQAEVEQRMQAMEQVLTHLTQLSEQYLQR